jgi:hypothetical protein
MVENHLILPFLLLSDQTMGLVIRQDISAMCQIEIRNYVMMSCLKHLYAVSDHKNRGFMVCNLAVFFYNSQTKIIAKSYRT